MDRVALEDGRSFLIATREKALADKVVAERGSDLRTQAGIGKHLLENMRIDFERLNELDPSALEEIAERFRSRRVRLLAKTIARIQLGKERW